jgi:hypothetical protein
VARVREERTCTRFWLERPKERDHSEDGGVDWKMGSELILGRLAGGIEWIQLAQDRDRWRALANTVINLGSGIAELGGRNRGMTVEFSIYTVSYAE